MQGPRWTRAVRPAMVNIRPACSALRAHTSWNPNPAGAFHYFSERYAVSQPPQPPPPCQARAPVAGCAAGAVPLALAFLSGLWVSVAAMLAANFRRTTFAADKKLLVLLGWPVLAAGSAEFRAQLARALGLKDVPSFTGVPTTSRLPSPAQATNSVPPPPPPSRP